MNHTSSNSTTILSHENIKFDRALINQQTALDFLATAHCACFKQAARSLNVPVVALRRKLEVLEDQIGSPIFIYKGNKLILTRTGQRLHDYLITSFGRDTQSKPVSKNTITTRIAIEEPLLSDIVCRELIAYIRENADLRLDVRAECNEAMLATGQYDIGLYLCRSDGTCANTTEGYNLEKVGILMYRLFIASRYARKLAIPMSTHDLDNFMLVIPPADVEFTHSPAWKSLVERHKGGSTQIRGHTLTRALIVGGACIGALPSYSLKIEKSIIVLPGLFDEIEPQHINLMERGVPRTTSFPLRTARTGSPALAVDPVPSGPP